MKILRSNRGATILELVAAIAIFSVVGLAAFTLLMFSIRTNNYIVDISDSTQEANLLNTRLELFFEDKIAAVGGKDDSTYGFLRLPSEHNEPREYFLLTFESNTLKCGEEVFSEKLSGFSLERIKGTKLIHVAYSIGDREFTKIFRLQDYRGAMAPSWNDHYWNNHFWRPPSGYKPPWLDNGYYPGYNPGGGRYP